MKVTQVSMRPTEAAIKAGAPALTPELLAACGARYSRSNEGLGEILSRIDASDLEKSVDSIFRLIDYGHQSIADMVPVAMFLDGISLWLAFHVWSLSPMAGGQESSTRYIRMNADSLLAPEATGMTGPLAAEWADRMSQSFTAYGHALDAWEHLALEEPDLTRIPHDVLEDRSDKGRRKAARMRRNYAFDRARYYLPFSTLTNVMLVMSARAWAVLCQNLCSHMLPEAGRLGQAIRAELELCAPRLLKHATRRESTAAGLAAEFARLQAAAAAGLPPSLQPGANPTDLKPAASLEVFPPAGTTEADFVAALQQHENRYAWIGSSLQRTGVRFAWDAVTLAEIRDLNRHRSGTRHCSLVPLGFYSALEQLPRHAGREYDALCSLNDIGRSACARARELLAEGNPAYVYWLPIGAQCAFEHTTTADKFIYEAELRTGIGAHYRYALHLHDALALWFERYPETRGLVLEGSAEPE